jgi:hypothetical protein
MTLNWPNGRSRKCDSDTRRDRVGRVLVEVHISVLVSCETRCFSSEMCDGRWMMGVGCVGDRLLGEGEGEGEGEK